MEKGNLRSAVYGLSYKLHLFLEQSPRIKHKPTIAKSQVESRSSCTCLSILTFQYYSLVSNIQNHLFECIYM